MQTVHIRKLDAADADDIGNIYGSIIRQPVDEEFNALIEKHARHESDICFVAELDGRVVGFMISYILTFSFGIEKSAWIATVGVDPDFMGRGIGERLFNEISIIYKNMGINRIYTTVPWDSSDLLSFFKSLGFDRSEFVNLRR
ncbi:MAG: GNAT family N-acetyltransferase [Deltaproteobacteria bacterium]|nr:GNAT family N-acetyltransferase [Deltaproteobacteria bacterium]